MILRKSACCYHSALCHRSGPSQMHKTSLFPFFTTVTAPTCDHAHLQTNMCTRPGSPGQQSPCLQTVVTTVGTHPLLPGRTCRPKAHFPSATAFSYLEEWGWDQKQSERGQPGLQPSSNNDGCHEPQWKMTQRRLFLWLFLLAEHLLRSFLPSSFLQLWSPCPVVAETVGK